MMHPDRPKAESLPFSNATISVMEVVRTRAVEDQRRIVGLEYVMGGLLTDEGISMALTAIGVDTQGLALAMDGMRRKGDDQFTGEETGKEQVLLGPCATFANRAARESALRAGSIHVGPVDILRELVTDRDWEGATTLDRFGVTPQAVAAIR